ncbi:hypothetical protein C1H46_028730 [Malus baccata]|uniref:Uncharacterized protein n=1 Tax=Malus baccata TaxID=106549 RepID=A0A540LGS2_MALBA|nr:hypothetical protein C1H46_028730 [Malus baccata]
MKAQVLRRLEASLALISVYAFANHLCFRQESLTKTLQGTSSLQQGEREGNEWEQGRTWSK